MFLSKFKAATVLIAILLACLGVATSRHEVLAQRDNIQKPGRVSEQAGQPKPAVVETPRVDLHGDALPPGALFRFGSIRFRHPGGIGSSALSSDGKLLATASGHSVMVWDMDSGRPLHRFVCPDDGAFVSPGITFSPDAKLIGYVHNSGFACVWDLKTLKEVVHLEGKNHHYALGQFTPDGKEFITSDRERLRYWDLQSGKEARSIPCGSNVLSLNAAVYVRVDEKAVTILGETRTGKVLRELKAPAAKNGIENGVAFSPDGKWLALVHIDKAVELRDTTTWELRAAFPLPAEAFRRKGAYPEYNVGLTGDGKTLFLGIKDGKLHRWDVASGKELPPLQTHQGRVAGIHHLPDGRTLVTTGADGLIRRWDLPSGEARSEPEGYRGRTCAAMSLGGQDVAIGDERGLVDLWDATTGKKRRTLQQKGPAVTLLVFAPDGKSLAVADNGAVRLLEVSSGNQERVFGEKETRKLSARSALLFSPDGKYLGANHLETGFHLWERGTGKLLWRWLGDQVQPAAFSPDGSTLATIFMGPGVILLDSATGKERSRFSVNRDDGVRADNPQALAFSPDGKILALALGDKIILCDARVGAEGKRFRAVAAIRNVPFQFRLSGQTHQVTALQFSPDGRWLVSGGSDNAVRLWEVASSKQVLEFAGHEGYVQGVAFGPGGRTAFSFARDAQAYLWELRPAPLQEPLGALWEILAVPEADRAYRAIWRLSEDGKGTAELLRSKIPAVQPADQDRLAKLIADLNSESFQTRNTAARELAKLGDRSASALEDALKKPLSVEVRRRLQNLLAALKREPTLEELREIRAVQALELAGTAEARALLRVWAGGAPGARLTEDARASLMRLPSNKQEKKPPKAVDGGGRPRPAQEKPAANLPDGAIASFGRMPFHNGSRIQASEMSPDGKLLATLSRRSATIWDIATGQPLHRFFFDIPGWPASQLGLAFSPDSKRFAGITSELIVVWDLTNGKELRRFTTETERRGFSFMPVSSEGTALKQLSPDGKTFVVVKETQRKVLIGDAATGKIAHTLPIAARFDGTDQGVLFLPDGVTLAVVHGSEKPTPEVQFWNFKTGKRHEKTWPLPNHAVGVRHRLALSPDGKVLIVSWNLSPPPLRSTLRRYEVETNKELPPIELGWTQAIFAHSDGKTLFAVGLEQIRRWNVATGKEISKDKDFLDWRETAVSRDGRWLALRGAQYHDGFLELCDTESRKAKRIAWPWGNGATLAFTSDNRSLVVNQYYHLQFLRVPDLAELNKLIPAEKYDITEASMHFSADGRHLAVVRSTGLLRFYDLNTRKEIWTLKETQRVLFTPDGKRLLVQSRGARGRGDLRMYDLATKKGLFEFKYPVDRGPVDRGDGGGAWIRDWAFSPNGRLLAAAMTGGHIVMLDAATGKERSRFLSVPIERVRGLEDHYLHTTALVFSPDGQWLAGGGDDGYLRIWEVGCVATHPTQRELHRLHGHEGATQALAFSGEGRRLVSFGDGEGMVWDLRPPRKDKKKSDPFADLLADDGRTVYRAMWALADDPLAPAMLREKIPPMRLDARPERITQLIADLESPRFPVRDAATRALAALQENARSALLAALQKNPSVETERRTRKLLATLDEEPNGPELRVVRAVRVMALHGSEAARDVLREWSEGTPGLRLTEQARAAVARILESDSKKTAEEADNERQCAPPTAMDA
jgi:WD40 repeat protein/HEAT repeat protein